MASRRRYISVVLCAVTRVSLTNSQLIWVCVRVGGKVWQIVETFQVATA